MNAVREQYPDRTLVACMELHTFSSLTQEFLKQYAGTMKAADTGIVFFDPHAVAHKKLPPITDEMIYDAFDRSDLLVFHSPELMKQKLMEKIPGKSVFLLMSSGNFSGIDLNAFAEELLKNNR